MSTEIVNEKKLRKLLAIMDEETLTRAEFLSAFEQVLKIVLDMKNQMGMSVSKLEQTYSALLERTKNDHSTTLNDLKSQVDSVFVGKQLDKMMKEHSERMASIRDGVNGKNGNHGKDGKPGKNGKDGTLLSAGQVRDKLETLKGDDRLDISAVKGLDEKLEEVKKSAGTRVIAGPNANAVQFADLSSQCDGSNKTFVTPKYRHALMLISTQAPLLYKPTTDYTLGNGKIILTAAVDAPATSQTLILLYIK